MHTETNMFYVFLVKNNQEFIEIIFQNDSPKLMKITRDLKFEHISHPPTFFYKKNHTIKHIHAELQ